jgi:hypothetical protein
MGCGCTHPAQLRLEPSRPLIVETVRRLKARSAITGSAGCCARAASGHAAATQIANPSATKRSANQLLLNVGRLIGQPIGAPLTAAPLHDAAALA